MVIQILLWTVLSAVFLIVAGGLGLSFYVSWKLTRGTRRKPLDESPEDYGLSFEKVEFPSTDGILLRGWFLPSQRDDATATVIFAHGYRGNRLEQKLPALQLANDLTDAGFNVLMFDFRNCGESGGKVTSIGLYETEDLLGAIQWVKSHHPASPIALHGFSMGASTSLIAASRSPEVAGIVADSPFESLTPYLADNFSVWTKLPNFPFTPLILGFIRLHVGNPDHVNPRAELDRIYPRPVLFIHGDADRAIPYWNSRNMYETHRDVFRFWRVANAGHVGSYRRHKEAYVKRIIQFFEELVVQEKGLDQVILPNREAQGISK
ncbi:alpha/beta hydrolase [Paenibacillus sp. J5C_2022]|uniref:alpha/beta hydrolase n=1 Tax=Paenibacillus sp. J5C2022 TaxID=2977129 RepID=UPI0021D30407|nr:alpha/beta hydrolase [Paenibacillus sp. J5C2022]MCU6708874.1 alpha/beta hydrolase [Paenibacillus sp. J5C2022]